MTREDVAQPKFCPFCRRGLSTSQPASPVAPAPVTSKGYDVKCGELAEYFLEDEQHEPEEVQSLAQCIQDAIENWFEPRESRPIERTP